VNNGIEGPVRVGIYETPSATRKQSGAGYFGVMELSGNLWERCVSAGTNNGYKNAVDFTGTHGTGNMSALPATWPLENGTGTGYRGGAWTYAASYARVSDRSLAGELRLRQFSGANGWRGVRSAP
jgi:hypothetical protein